MGGALIGKTGAEWGLCNVFTQPAVRLKTARIRFDGIFSTPPGQKCSRSGLFISFFLDN
jgi:hypothetical protein